MSSYYDSVLELTTRIEKHWLNCNYASQDFYKVVWEETEGFDFSPLADVAGQLELLDHPSVRLNQHRSTFSDLHFQIFHNGRFLIEILNWHGSHVNVHDHDFSGVQFQLKGDSLNVVYDFQEKESAGALRFGNLNVRRAEIWHEGGRSIVRAGDVDPHAVFHLSRPTTSLLVRTAPTPRLGSQSNYFPTLAAHYYVNNDIQRKKLTGLALLERESCTDFRHTLKKFMDSQSLSENFFMMLKLGPLLLSEAYVDLIQEYAARGDRETAVVESVVYNNGIDFLKIRASALADITPAEHLAVSCIAASTGPFGFAKVMSDLNGTLDIPQAMESFLKKLDAPDQITAQNYLAVFNLDFSKQMGVSHA